MVRQMTIVNTSIGESLVIGENVVITVLNIKNNQVCFGIDIPKDTLLYLREDKLKKNKNHKKL